MAGDNELELLANIALSTIWLVVGTILGVWGNRRFDDSPKLHWTVVSQWILSPSSRRLQGLTAKFDDMAVSIVTLTKVKVWNSGKHALESHDMAADDPLRVVLPRDINVLSVELTHYDRPNSEAIMRQVNEETCVVLSFPYLKHQEGIVVSVYADGTLRDGLRVAGDFSSLTGTIDFVEHEVWRTASRWKYEVKLKSILGLVLFTIATIPTVQIGGDLAAIAFAPIYLLAILVLLNLDRNQYYPYIPDEIHKK